MKILEIVADTMKEIKHYPVMYREVVELLDIKKRNIIVDCTVGIGGHALKFLQIMEKNARFIGIDEDKESLKIASDNLKSFEGRFSLIQDNFSNLDKILDNLNIEGVDAFLFDLGISRYQLNEPDRGFSFLKEGPLDMRMNRDSAVCAYDLVNNLSEKELMRIFKEFGEERYSRRIAHSIVEARRKEPISSTTQLVQVILSTVPSRMLRYRIHPATKVFQALRIAVNRELEAISVGLKKAVSFLNKGGRIAVISFHSLEDRIAKFCFRGFASQGILNIINKKPLVPSATEIEENASSRSAKLRVAEKN